jgi:pyridoxine 5-phosphate synthase
MVNGDGIPLAIVRQIPNLLSHGAGCSKVVAPLGERPWRFIETPYNRCSQSHDYLFSIMPELGVNIDHVATLRQARYRDYRRGSMPEPSILEAARLAERGGAAAITVHLREDRRHIQPEDVRLLRGAIRARLNLEMAVTAGMVREALRYRPDEVCLVPENRREVTTEGGLNVAGDLRRVKNATKKLTAKKIIVSAFIDPVREQVLAAAEVGAPCIELHTGAYANATTKKKRLMELRRHARAAELALELGLQVNAGHGLRLTNLTAYLQAVPGVETLNIGHSIVARALTIGLEEAVREFVRLIKKHS